MTYFGDERRAAPTLSEIHLPKDEAESLFQEVLRNIEILLEHGLIHGDLSAYNILYWQGRVTIIDFAQAVDPRYNPEVYELLARDIERVYRYFAPYGVVADPSAIAADLWTRSMLGEL